MCAADAPFGLIDEALRFAELRGEYVSLDGQRARRPAQGDRVAPYRPLAPGWEEVDWRVVFARAWPSAPMVQAVGELHAAELAFEYAARRVDWHGAQQLALLDARAALGAVARARGQR